MQTFITVNELREFVAFNLASGRSIGFVPTMGALHDGHISLIKRSLSENELTVCSIFVNPSQFNDPKDFERYPRELSRDTAMLDAAGCDVLFAPAAAEMYPSPDTTRYDLSPIDQVLEGAFRPGHFNGVASVVKRLLEMVRPTRAYFGKKDYQQYLVVKALNEMFNLGVEIVGCEIVREESGLAMSSRNKLLSSEGKNTATAISETLKKVKSQAGAISIDKLEDLGREILNKNPGIDLEYFSVSHPETLQPFPPGSPSNQPTIALTAARVEGVRLIDNMPVWE